MGLLQDNYGTPSLTVSRKLCKWWVQYTDEDGEVIERARTSSRLAVLFLVKYWHTNRPVYWLPTPLVPKPLFGRLKTDLQDITVLLVFLKRVVLLWAKPPNPCFYSVFDLCVRSEDPIWWIFSWHIATNFHVNDMHGINVKMVPIGTAELDP